MLYVYPYSPAMPAADVEQLRHYLVGHVTSLFTGKEQMLFLGPPADVSVETLRVLGVWDVQRMPGDIIAAVHPDRDRWRTEDPEGYARHKALLEIPINTFIGQVASERERIRGPFPGGAIASGEDMPSFLSDTGMLRTYYEEVGAYYHPYGPPSLPPPVP